VDSVLTAYFERILFPLEWNTESGRVVEQFVTRMPFDELGKFDIEHLFEYSLIEERSGANDGFVEDVFGRSFQEDEFPCLAECGDKK
jgi:hypothetical protein